MGKWDGGNGTDRGRAGGRRASGSRARAGGGATGARSAATGAAARAAGAIARFPVGSSLAGGLALWEEILWFTILADNGAGVRENDVVSFSGHAAIDVGNEHLGEVVALGEARGLSFGIAFLGSSFDSDGSAVHVHLTVADTIEPSPSKGVLSGRDAVGNGEVEDGVRISREVPLGIGGASTFERLDDHPVGVLGGFHISSQTDLARATTVNGTAEEAQLLGFTDLKDVGLSRGLEGVGTELAREVTAIRGQRGVVEGAVTVGNRSLHLHMGIDGRSTEHGDGHESRLGEDHFELRVACVVRQSRNVILIVPDDRKAGNELVRRSFLEGMS